MHTMGQIMTLQADAQKETSEFRLNCYNQLLKQLRNIEPTDEKAKNLLQDAIEITIKGVATAESDLKMLEMFGGLFLKMSAGDGGLESSRPEE